MASLWTEEEGGGAASVSFRNLKMSSSRGLGGGAEEEEVIGFDLLDDAGPFEELLVVCWSL